MTDDPVLNAAPADEPEKTEPSPRDLWTQRGHEIITETVKRAKGAPADTVISAVLHALFSHMSQTPEEHAAHRKELADAEAKRVADEQAAEDARTKARADAALAAAEAPPAPMATDPDYRTAEQRALDARATPVPPAPEPEQQGQQREASRF